MKPLILCILIFFSISSFSQETVVITSRENVPLQAVMNIGAGNILYAGQEYTFTITTSGEYDIRLETTNVKVHLIEESKLRTGGLSYVITPIDTGWCSIGISNQIDENRTVGLKTHNFKVINYPVPPLRLKGIWWPSQIISNLKYPSEIQCAYNRETGIWDSYEIESWTAKIGNKKFSGQGSLLSEELIQYVNEVDNQYLHFKVVLCENKTGHLKSDGIYYIRKSE